MGNTQSPTGGPRFTSACRAFSQAELEDLKSLFDSLASQSQSNGQFVSPTSFQAYFKIHGPLGDRMFDLVSQKRNDQKITFEDLVIAKGTYEKGTKDEIEQFIYELVDVDGDGTVGRSDMEAVLKAVLDDILSGSSESGSNSNQESIEAFLNGVNFPEIGEGSAKVGITFEDFRRWCAHFPSLRKYLGSLLSSPDPGRLGSQVPHLLYFDNMESNSLLLKKEYAWHIGGALPQLKLDEWKLLYHSAFSGLSFNTFLGNISNDEGPTVLIIKDKEGCIYGGYASQPWERHADYYGDMKSFLFQLYPRASIFKPTGANNNIQWCAVNFTSASIPNGIGFGGRVGHFGLFLSASFDRGHTFECTTFGSPCFSKTNQICPDVIECWGIVQKGAQQEKPDGIEGSVLERFKEDRNMLKLVGLANSSA